MGACGLADQCCVHKPRFINGYTGNAGKVTGSLRAGGAASPTQREKSLDQFVSRERWAPRPVFTG